VTRTWFGEKKSSLGTANIIHRHKTKIKEKA
jgi:hypothetical protein